MRSAWALLLLLAPGLLALGAGAERVDAAPPEEPLRLANGLEVLLRPLPGARTTALVLVLRVGEHHDPAGASGLSHLVEHCFVTAAAGAYPACTFEQLLARYPAGHTAQTADRHTIVGLLVPPERVAAELEELAARLGGLTITAADLERETPRMLLEVANMFERLPGHAAMNRARERALPTPSGGRRAGLPAHIEALTLEAARSHAARHYTAGNAVLSVAGAFDAVALRALIERAFGALARGERPLALSPATHAPRTGIDLAVLAGLGTNGRACVAFPAPEPTSERYAPFLVLAARLLDPRAPAGDFPPPLYFAPLDEPGALYVSTALESGESAEAAVARVHRRVAEAVSQPYGPADALRALNLYGGLLGLVEPPPAQAAQNPYLAAMGPAARRVLGLDPALLSKQLVKVRSLPLSALAAELFDPLRSGAAVVTPPR